MQAYSPMGQVMIDILLMDRAKLGALYRITSSAIHDHAHEDSEAQSFFIQLNLAVQDAIVKTGGHVHERKLRLEGLK
jgi:hypothetical protein